MKKTPAEAINESKKSVSKILESGNTLGAVLSSIGHSIETLDNINFNPTAGDYTGNTTKKWVKDNWNSKIETSKPFNLENDALKLEGTAFKIGSSIFLISRTLSKPYNEIETDEPGRHYIQGSEYTESKINAGIFRSSISIEYAIEKYIEIVTY
jgi:hypothetical protein